MAYNPTVAAPQTIGLFKLTQREMITMVAGDVLPIPVPSALYLRQAEPACTRSALDLHPQVENLKCWKWRSFTKVTIPILVRRNSSYDKFIASIMQRGDLDCTSCDVMISYVMYLSKKVNPTIINSDVHVMTYIIDADADGFRLILRINMVERFFEGPLNSSASLPRCPAVNNDLIDDDLNDYKNDVDDTINMEDYSMHMEDFSSDSQDAKEDRKMESQAGHSFTDETNFCCGQTFIDKKEQKYN
ncbi:hypothetical protein T459_20166 [Capsicum annuum]|uniref:Uncharacterized protein n=1 Tax=Capsicum annuum TaxID=4072 RepID=A0A2G2Z3W5_CAPAN|nr:hypothetical protein T459_20166 [Capsicum annuum]